jgi:hypothetical protein
MGKRKYSYLLGLSPMKKDKDIVLSKIRTLDKSKLHFVDTDYFDNIKEDQDNVKYKIRTLKSFNYAKDRLLRIIELVEDFVTYDANNKYQCRAGANRSAVDIWRIYNNYFRPVSLFYIMRTLYKLVIEDDDLETLFCNDIKKQVFVCGSGFDTDSIFIVNELGVRFAEWRNIGL